VSSRWWRRSSRARATRERMVLDGEKGKMRHRQRP
jgi:hypothetical protein